MKISKMIRGIKEHLKLTNSDIAYLTDRSERSVLRWGKGQSIPRENTILRLCEIYALKEGPSSVKEQKRKSREIFDTLERKTVYSQTLIGYLLRQYKEYFELSIKDLSDEIGFDHSTVSKWLSGRSLPQSWAAENILLLFKRGYSSGINEMMFWDLYHFDLRARSKRSHESKIEFLDLYQRDLRARSRGLNESKY